MKTNKVIVSILSILVLFGCTSLNAAEKKEHSNTRQASAVVRIQMDHSFLSVYDGASLYPLFTPAIQQAMRDVFGYQEITYPPEQKLVNVQFLKYSDLSQGEYFVQCSLSIDLNNDLGAQLPKAAEELKGAIIDGLKENLSRAFEEYRQSHQDRHVVYARQVAEAEAQMNRLQKAILEITGGKKMSREFLEDQITGLSKELQEAEFQLRVSENQINHLQDRLKNAEAVKAGKGDPVLPELKQKIELLEQTLQNTKKMAESGRVSATEIQEIEQRLIEARIELAERREMAEESPEAHHVRELKERLTHLSLERSEQEMRIRFLHIQLEEARSMLGRSTEYETLRIKAEVQRQLLYDSIEQLEELRRDNSLLTPPILTIISQ